jgi:hypothetical protein
MERTLLISDTVPGFVRTPDVEALLRYATVVNARGAHHLAETLQFMANELLAGNAVSVHITQRGI